MKSILSRANIFKLFKLCFSLCGGSTISPFLINHYLRPQRGCRMLDIGCGICDILKYLPEVDYVGLDANKKYIDYAKKCGFKGNFYWQAINEDLIGKFSSFDIVLAKGILHHLNDEDALTLFLIAKHALNQKGSLITFDGCFVDGQSRFTRHLLLNDRGEYVRNEAEYLCLASKVFSNVKVSIHNNLLKIPYTYIIMECSL